MILPVFDGGFCPKIAENSPFLPFLGHFPPGGQKSLPETESFADGG